MKEEYLTVDELAARIKFSRQTLYNLIHKGTFVRGRHFLKPTPKKILFKWSAIQAWMGEEHIAVDESFEHPIDHPVRRTPKNLIRI
jgi:excisionase family DNA binding protein